jgi:beta-glucosidase
MDRKAYSGSIRQVCYLFHRDDGYRIWFNNKLVVDEWEEHGPIEGKFTVDLKAKSEYDIKIEYFQAEHGAVAQLKWLRLMEGVKDQYLKEAVKCDVIVYFGGLSAALEGEEMPVSFDGFDGGDRTKIDLPIVQTNTLKKLKALGKLVILVICAVMCSSTNWENENLDAILQAFTPGQEGGTACCRCFVW